MKLTHLEIRRTSTYETPSNQLVGLLELTGEQGQIKVTLSARAINNLLLVIGEEVKQTAKGIANQVGATMIEAQNETLLLENDGDIPQ